ncbi:hypothetical protein [Flavobacterium sp. 102]|uniref:hypothetical protein n=1 Tax=Flavobacterium sp. 102 TaxID=2135623 RepID=UPI000EB0A7B7|nr:hypothetical protein [Flavobacterium sp. 102]RKS03243.1 hypothetical protein C8C84_2987 [Flavobacterium sp. 102]
MNNLILALFLLLNITAFAQKPCEIDNDIKDSLGTYKSTKQYIIFERSFAGNSTDIFFSLSNDNGILGLEIQILQRSQDFIKAICFDAGSKIYLQLNNGKIVTLLYAGKDTCGNLLRDENNSNNRITTGNFVFSKENFEALKTSPVTFMRIKYAGETIDYPYRTAFVSELDKKVYEPEGYFINFLKCVEN